ncbi:MAG TPA: sterol desaturase family protein [Pyrinomonadaceae bacterium]|nr:sterol desaturase family protein [Pyrinomonadaceae bacterium]
MSIAGLKQLTPGFFYTAVVACLFTFARSYPVSWRQSLLLIGVGVLSWMLIEYLLHRVVFHYSARSDLGRKIVYAAHLSHHDNPTDRSGFLSSLLISLPIATPFVFLVWAAIGSLHLACYFFIGLAAGYSCYKWLHFQAHHRRPRLRLFRYLRTYHLLHHHQTPELRFGVTSPLFDVIFGTFRPVSKRLLSR